MGSAWRNRAFRAQLAVMVAAGAVLIAVCFRRDAIAGIAACGMFLALFLTFGAFTRARYRQIAQLSEQLARIAGGDFQVRITAYAEGELSILSSEILKITTALSHQARSLRQDKTFLADTMADISHQLKTPLTSLSMMADLLEAPDLPEAKRLEFLRGMRTSLDRIQWLIASLLRLSRLDAGAVVFRTEPVSLADVVADAAGPLRVLAAQRGLTLDTAPEQDILLETDRRWLAEAVGNVVKNCVEHTGAGGCVRVRCDRNPLYVQITVSDNGPGIDAKDLAHIFERFYRGANASPDSVGIGLALSKSIVQNLGGTLQAENRPEGGARFTIRLYGRPDRPVRNPSAS